MKSNCLILIEKLICLLTVFIGPLNVQSDFINILNTVKSGDNQLWTKYNSSKLNENQDVISDKMSQVPNLQFDYGDPLECFTDQGHSPYPCNFKGTPTSLDVWPEQGLQSRTLESTIQKRQAEVVEDLDPLPPGDGLIEGAGSYLCILRGSELGGEVFIRDVGIFRCNFQNAYRIKTSIVGGIGYYQCNFQKPGTEQILTQGVGWYVCLFGGARRVRGIPENPDIFASKHFDSFCEVLGSVTGNFVTGSSITGRVQLLGFYQIGPTGHDVDLNFGFIQVLEGFHLAVEDITDAKALAKKNKIKKNKQALTTVDQLGTAHYSWKGTDVENGQSQFNHIIGSHIVRQWGPHRFHLFISRYDYLGQLHIYGQNEDIVQVWGYYDYDFESKTNTKKNTKQVIGQKESSIHMRLLEGMIISEYNLEENIIDFIQLIGQLGWEFTGPHDAIGELGLIGVYQTNSEKTLSGRITDLFIFIFQISYVLTNNEKVDETETGFFQIYAIYNYYIELIEERAGWIQCATNYAKVFQGSDDRWWNPIGTIFSISITLEYEIDFPTIAFTNGFYEIILSYTVDLSILLKDDNNFSVMLKEYDQSPGVIIFAVIYRCYVFGVASAQKWVCFYQPFVRYTFTTGEQPIDGRLGGQVVDLMVQGFQEVRNDNAVL